VSLNKHSGPRFAETVYVFEVNGARKVKSIRARSHEQELERRAEVLRKKKKVQ